jgi:hypothetical protein
MGGRRSDFDGPWRFCRVLGEADWDFSETREQHFKPSSLICS